MPINVVEKKPYIINTSRGEVIETEAILNALSAGKISGAIIDVWENEPNINLELLDKVFIGTPHIAGYSADGKANATRMSLDAICKFFHIEGKYEINAPAPTSPIIHAQSQEEALLQIYNPVEDSARQLQMYNPHLDCEVLRAHPETFEQLRSEYHLRRE